MTAAKGTPHPDSEGASEAETAATDDTTPSLLELLVSSEGAAPPLADRIDGVVIGRVVGLVPAGVCVVFAGAPPPSVTARALVALGIEDVGREVALMFEGGDPRRPLVMGRVVSPLAPGATEGAVDGERVEIQAEREIVLRCGESSITLTRAGKVLICGAYVLTRATGVNRVQGAAVEIN